MRDKEVKKCFEEAMGLNLTPTQSVKYFEQQGIKKADLERYYKNNFNKGIVNKTYKASIKDKVLFIVLLILVAIMIGMGA